MSLKRGYGIAVAGFVSILGGCASASGDADDATDEVTSWDDQALAVPCRASLCKLPPAGHQQCRVYKHGTFVLSSETNENFMVATLHGGGDDGPNPEANLYFDLHLKKFPVTHVDAGEGLAMRVKALTKVVRSDNPTEPATHEESKDAKVLAVGIVPGSFGGWWDLSSRDLWLGKHLNKPTFATHYHQTFTHDAYTASIRTAGNYRFAFEGSNSGVTYEYSMCVVRAGATAPAGDDW